MSVLCRRGQTRLAGDIERRSAGIEDRPSLQPSELCSRARDSGCEVESDLSLLYE